MPSEAFCMYFNKNVRRTAAILFPKGGSRLIGRKDCRTVYAGSKPSQFLSDLAGSKQIYGTFGSIRVFRDPD